MKYILAVLIASIGINLFNLAFHYHRYGDLCPLVCVYSNQLGARWAETEIFGQRTIWKNEEAKREVAETDRWERNP